jgi:hypothetical protein
LGQATLDDCRTTPHPQDFIARLKVPQDVGYLWFNFVADINQFVSFRETTLLQPRENLDIIHKHGKLTFLRPYFNCYVSRL